MDLLLDEVLSLDSDRGLLEALLSSLSVLRLDLPSFLLSLGVSAPECAPVPRLV